MSDLYDQLKITFDKDNPKFSETQTDHIITKFMNSSRIIRFPHIYQNERNFHLQIKRRRLN
jgi:hypothetical protein